MIRLNHIGGLICGTGLVLTGFTAGWLAALGVFLALWGYGVQQAARGRLEKAQ